MFLSASLFPSFIKAENTWKETQLLAFFLRVSCAALALRSDREPDLSPAAVPADHVRAGHGVEERVRLQVLRQAREELRDVDEVHLQQDFLVQMQDAQTRPE